MKVRLTERGLMHYSERGAVKRSRAIGTCLCTLPSGDMAVEWPWGLSFVSSSEVEYCP